MSIRSLATKIHIRWLHEIRSLPYWFRWLETEAPIVADKYRSVLRSMWIYWLPAMILFALSLKLSRLLDIPATLSMPAFAIACGGFGLIVFLFPAIALANIGIAAYRWSRIPAAPASRKMYFFTTLFFFGSAICFLAFASFIGIALLALLQK